MTRTVFSCLLVLLYLPFIATADTTVRMPNGTVYENAEIREVDSETVLLQHAGGLARIPLVEIPRDTRRQLQLKPTAATAKHDFLEGARKLAEPFDTLARSYEARLESLAKKAQGEGLLKPLLEIRQEIEGFEDGTSEPPYDYAELAKLREIYDRELENRRQSSLAKMRTLLTEYREELRTAKRELTIAERLDEAVAVDVEEERILAMIADPGKALTEFGVAAAKGSEPGASPVGDAPATGGMTPPDFSQLPRCRLVIIPVRDPTGNPAPASFGAVEASDFTDLAATGRPHFPNVGAIRADGSLVYWKDGEAEPRVVPGSNIQCDQSHGLPFVGLDRDGTLNFTEDASVDLLKDLGKQTGVARIAATIGAIALVSRGNGAVTVLGERSDHVTAKALMNLEGVRDVAFSGLAFASVLRNDGSVVRISNGEAAELAPGPDLVKLHSNGIGEDEEGNLVSFGGFPQSDLDKMGRHPRQVFQAGDFLGGIDAAGVFHCRSREKGGNAYKSRPEIEAALHGASAFTASLHGDGIWILALLPAETVPRSGLWNPEELIAARTP